MSNKQHLLSKDLRGDVEFLPSKVVPEPTKKRGAKQKERDKKKLQKLLDKKAKQDKMKNILSSLEAHKSDIKDEDYSKFQSAKLLGKQQTERKHTPEKLEPKSDPVVYESSSSDEDIIIKSAGYKPELSQAVRE